MIKDWQEYRDTGTLGAYHPDRAILRKDETGGIDTIFRDTSHWQRPKGFVRERVMLIGGKRFFITSVFHDAPTATPTDKLLSLIDSELEKETHSA